MPATNNSPQQQLGLLERRIRDCLKLLRKQNVHLRQDDFHNEFKWPSIVVIGEIGVGKSSVCGRLVGKQLPRGVNCVTRRPIQLKISPNSLNAEGESFGGNDEQMVNETEIHEFSTVPLFKNLLVQEDDSAFYLFDLPGYSRLPRSGQPENIEHISRDLLFRHCLEDEGALIVMALAADCDPGNSDVLRICRESLDPKGQRTIVAVSKWDLVEPEILSETWSAFEETLQPCRAIIALKNPSQISLKLPESNVDSSEKEFFRKQQANCLFKSTGVNCFRQEVLKFFCEAAWKWLQNAAHQLRQLESQLRNRLLELSDPNRHLNLLTEYIETVLTAINGGDFTTYSIAGRIGLVLRSLLPQALQSIDPIHLASQESLLISIRNSKGISGNVMKIDAPFHGLVREALQQYRQTVNDCFRAIFVEMEDLLHISGYPKKMRQEGEKDPRHTKQSYSSNCNSEDEDEFFDVTSLSDMEDDSCTFLDPHRQPSSEEVPCKREIEKIPQLATSINRIIHELLAKLERRTVMYINDYFEMEADCIESLDDEFLQANWNLFDHFNTAPKAEDEIFTDSLPFNSIESFEDPDPGPQKPEQHEKDSFLNDFMALFFSHNRSAAGKVEYRPGKFRKSTEIRGKFSKLGTNGPNPRKSVPYSANYNAECEFIISLTQSYLNVLKRSLADFVPKAIKHFLINSLTQALPQNILSLLEEKFWFKETGETEGIKSMLKEMEEYLTKNIK